MKPSWSCIFAPQAANLERLPRRQDKGGVGIVVVLRMTRKTSCGVVAPLTNEDWYSGRNTHDREVKNDPTKFRVLAIRSQLNGEDTSAYN